jgi:hypothetical protein
MPTAKRGDMPEPDSRTRWWQLKEMPESDGGHRRLLKGAIVLIVFPTLFLIVMRLWVLIVLAVAWTLPRDPTSARWVGWGLFVVGMTLAGWAAFWPSRWLWPKAPTGSRA